jgi:hypothetical protein
MYSRTGILAGPGATSPTISHVQARSICNARSWSSTRRSASQLCPNDVLGLRPLSETVLYLQGTRCRIVDYWVARRNTIQPTCKFQNFCSVLACLVCSQVLGSCHIPIGVMVVVARSSIVDLLENSSAHSLRWVNLHADRQMSTQIAVFRASQGFGMRRKDRGWLLPSSRQELHT